MRCNSSIHVSKDSKFWTHHIDPVRAHNLRARLVQSRHMLFWVSNNIYTHSRRCAHYMQTNGSPERTLALGHQICMPCKQRQLCYNASVALKEAPPPTSWYIKQDELSELQSGGSS